MSLAVQQLRKSLFEHGYKLVPVHTGQKRPWGEEWNTRALQQSAQDAAAWPDAAALNTGLLLCEGVFALDFDVDAPEQVKALEELAFHALGYAPVRRREGTAHSLLLYRMESGASPQSKKMGSKGAMLELRGAGTQVVGWGHFEGHAYSWTEDLSRRPVTLLSPVTEDALRAFLEAAAAVLGCEAPSERKKAATRQPDATAGRSVTAAERMYATKALAEEAAKLASTKTGRNDALNTAAHSVGTMVGAGWLGREEAASALWDASEANGYRSKDGDAEARKTLLSGLEAGEAKARDPLPILEVPANLANIKPKQAAPGAKRRTGARLVQLSTVTMEEVTWLWPGFLPHGKLAVLAGPPGVGKSTLAFTLAAIVSRGGNWPDGTKAGAPGNVLIWSGEDAVNDTIAPRLAAAGADLSRIHVIEGKTTEDGASVSFDPANDIESLRAEVERIGGASLLILDPLVSAVKNDGNKNNDVRRDLQPIVDFAQQFRCATLGLTHFRKGSAGANVLERLMGSLAFGALARVVLGAAKDEQTGQCSFVRIKSNIGPDDGGVRYSIREVFSGRIAAAQLVWGELLQGTARQIFAEVEQLDNPDDPHRQLTEAKRFLQTELRSGARPAKELLELAKQQYGIAEMTLRRAQRALGIKPQKAGFGGQWLWSLPMDFDALLADGLPILGKAVQ